MPLRSHKGMDPIKAAQSGDFTDDELMRLFGFESFLEILAAQRMPKVNGAKPDKTRVQQTNRIRRPLKGAEVNPRDPAEPV